MNIVKSGFIQKLAHFWNNYFSKQSRFILINCGSASSFERLVLRYIPKLKQRLGIVSVYTEVYNLYSLKEQDKVVQADLLLSGKDNVVNICETKRGDTF